MYETLDLIRQKAGYSKLADGAWQAEFAGRTLKVSVTAPTLEEARRKMIDALDARFVAMLCDELGIAEEGRTRSAIGRLRISVP